MDYRNPDYVAVLAERGRRLAAIRENPELLTACKLHYRDNPWDMVNDWGMTYDPRRVAMRQNPVIPFILWPRQVEFLKWLYSKWRNNETGLVEKSRDAGATWLCVGFAITLWLLEDGFLAGFGSRKEELVDKGGDDKSIFEKLRLYLKWIPNDFMPKAFNERQHCAHMRVKNPENGAAIIGEAGNEIGRGGRTSIYFVDEAAYIERQLQVDAALSQNTNCQIDLSTYNGNGNEYYKKSMLLDGTDRKFVFDWRHDPRKDQAWYDYQKANKSEVIVAQEIDRDPNASQEDIFIPGKYVAAIIDAHKILRFGPSGIRVAAFDPADTGDAKAVVCRHGSIIQGAHQMKQGDITSAIPWSIAVADSYRADSYVFDADGMGAPTIKMSGQAQNLKRMAVVPYWGSGGVKDPKSNAKIRKIHTDYKAGDSQLEESRERTNADTYANFRAQACTWFYLRCMNTYHAIEAVKAGKPYLATPDDLISIDSSTIDPAILIQLKSELSRPKRKYTNNGKILVESKKEMKARSVESPNLFDAAVMSMAVNQVPAISHVPLRSRPGVVVRPMRNQMV